ncbi:hypothetical protein HZH68_011852 [Vespula germanica]|uniref:Uncharacterized protein n=1 Tax=Vespula germanica TaxID=30212 RepID=A0A834JL44_VESGE|nr:hypothetical protein HZH68_011852 [Vespula germanica]
MVSEDKVADVLGNCGAEFRSVGDKAGGGGGGGGGGDGESWLVDRHRRKKKKEKEKKIDRKGFHEEFRSSYD